MTASGSELGPSALHQFPMADLLRLLRPQNLPKKANLMTGLTLQFGDKRFLSSQTQIWLLCILFARNQLGLTQLQPVLPHPHHGTPRQQPCQDSFFSFYKILQLVKAIQDGRGRRKMSPDGHPHVRENPKRPSNPLLRPPDVHAFCFLPVK